MGGADCSSAPAGVYEPATPLGVDAPLVIEPDAARLLAERRGQGAQASAIYLGEGGANIAINYAGGPEGVKTRRLAMTQLNVTDAGCGAVKGADGVIPGLNNSGPRTTRSRRPGRDTMHPMFVGLFMKTDADDLLSEKDRRHRSRRSRPTMIVRPAARVRQRP
jgi:hypothetical protein